MGRVVFAELSVDKPRRKAYWARRKWAARKFSWRRLAASVAMGFAIEGLLFYPVVTGTVPHWASARGMPGFVYIATQQPGLHLMGWLVDVIGPGFEEQVAYIFFVPFIQWLVYSAIIYLLLRMIARRKSVSRSTFSPFT